MVAKSSIFSNSSLTYQVTELPASVSVVSHPDRKEERHPGDDSRITVESRGPSYLEVVGKGSNSVESLDTLGSHRDSSTHSRGQRSLSPLTEQLALTPFCSHGRYRSSDSPFSNPSANTTPDNTIPVWETHPCLSLMREALEKTSSSSDQGSTSLSKLDKGENQFGSSH